MKAKLQGQPLLSIGMIVKNEEGSLEKCLQSLQPLRDAVASELIIADTGSTDGTWEIARQYADILFPFEWVDDFAAARNATLDKASGKWFMFIDADEWFESTEEIIGFFQSSTYKKYASATYIQRNYLDMNGEGYNDFFAPRMFCRTEGRRFRGRVHENVFLDQPLMNFHDFVHHYGYVNEGVKAKRNIPLLWKRLEEKDGSIAQIYHQLAREKLMDVDRTECISLLYKGVEALTEQEHSTTMPCGIYHDLAHTLSKAKRFQEVIQVCKDYFSVKKQEFATHVDMYYLLAVSYMHQEDYENAVGAYQNYLRLLDKLEKGELNEADRSVTILVYHTKEYHLMVLNNCLYALQKLEHYEDAFQIVDDYFAYLADKESDDAPFFAGERECVKALKNYSRYVRRYAELKAGGNTRQLESLRSNIDYLMFGDMEEAYPGLAEAFAYLEEDADPFLKLMRLRYSAAADDFSVLEDLLENAPPEEQYAELVYFAMKAGGCFVPYIRRVDSDELQGYMAKMKRYPDLMEVISAYYAQAPASRDLIELRWELVLLEYALLKDGKIDSSALTDTDMLLFERYCTGLSVYVQGVYREELLQDGDILVLPRSHRFGLQMGRAFACKAQGDLAGFLRSMQPAGERYPMLTPYLWRAKDQVQEALYAEEQREMEREMVARQIKDAILKMIDRGAAEEAEQALFDYAKLNPDDDEILSIRLQLRMAGYRS